MIEIIAKMESKDLLTLVVGSFALLISLSTLLYNIISKSSESRRSARDDFADIIEKLVDLRKEREDLRLQAGNEWLSSKYTTIRGAINDRRELLISRAHLVRTSFRIPVSDVQNLILGSSHGDAGHLIAAVQCYENAVKATKTAQSKAWALRALGMTQIRIGDVAEGRGNILKSLGIYLQLADEKGQDMNRMNYSAVETLIRLVQTQLSVYEHEHIISDTNLLIENSEKVLNADDRRTIDEAINQIDKEIELRGISSTAHQELINAANT